MPLESAATQQLLKRSQRLRANGHFLPPAAVRMRKQHLLQKAFAVEKAPEDPDKPPEMPAQDPMAMMGMMKQNIAMLVPNMVMMGWVSYFFSGFVLVKLPFPLTDRFKIMLQRGISLTSLNVSYVSSLSWYFTLMFGLRGLYGLILGGGAGAASVTEAEIMQRQMQGAAMAPTDPSKLFKTESTELEILDQSFLIPDAESRLLRLRLR